MNIHQLEYFVTLSEKLNFTKAAETCHISQTAMTQQIKSLEALVGVPLFVRDKHHVTLTAAGRLYAEEARSILTLSDRALRMARLVSEGTRGDLTIGFGRGYSQTRLTDRIHHFHKAYPLIQLHLFCENTSVLFERVVKNECDIIFTVAPRYREYQDLDYKYIASFPVLAVMPAGHPLAKLKTLSYKDLKGEDFIMMEPSNRPKDQMEESILIYERGGYYPNVVAMEGNPETLMLMIRIGMGISIVPEYLLQPYENDNRIAAIPLIKEDGTTETIDFEMDYPKNSSNPALTHFLDTLDLR